MSQTDRPFHSNFFPLLRTCPRKPMSYVSPSPLTDKLFSPVLWFFLPVYFPKYHPFLFESQNSMCHWLLSGLKKHLVESHSCLHRPFLPPTTHMHPKNEVCYVAPTFHINLYGFQTQISIADVESCLFSFCRLHRSFFTPSSNKDEWLAAAQSVLIKVPSWMTCNENCYFTCLLRLSIPELSDVAWSLHHSDLRQKSGFINTILIDFLHEQLQFFSRSNFTMRSCTVSASQYFVNWYCDSIACALQDLWLPHHFQHVAFQLHYLKVFSDGWLTESFSDSMSTKFARIPKEDIMQCLQSLPSHIRPTYNTWTIRVCRSVLLTHIHSRILYLASLSNCEFFHMFFSLMCCQNVLLSPPLPTNIRMALKNLSL